MWAKRPFIRGMLLLWDTLGLGMRALVYSANVQVEAEEEEAKDQGSGAGSGGNGSGSGVVSSQGTQGAAQEHSEAAAREAFAGKVMWGAAAGALVFGIGIFFVTPLLLASLVERALPVEASSALTVVVEGVIRLALFFGYVWLIGRLPDVRRVFAYHGAEHKTINAFEAGEPLRADCVERYSVAHPRCGTSFLLYVVVISIFVFGLLGHPPLPLRIASRIVLVPIIAAVAYEVIRFSGRRSRHPVVRALLAPGMALQALTTREPVTSQVEVAIAALDRVLELDGIARAPVAENGVPAGAPAGIRAGLPLT
ncbi:MAG: DUF1385 domain-containing protein [Chloroflexi bacterium]|nr:DUF1385 domain-containing protein [Chloroflexota bacterium]